MLMHEKYMQLALGEAVKALKKGEVPIGAVVVEKNNILGKGHNLIESLQDPTAHAEIISIGAATNTKNSWRLNEATLYVTIEPCTMCIGAIILARFKHLVFGAFDKSMGACGSIIDIPAKEKINHTVEVTSGVLELECSGIIQSFFKNLRNKQKDSKKS